jgi:hypothetical protein
MIILSNYSGPLINLFAALVLLLAFAMLAQRRVLALINLLRCRDCCWRRTAMVAYFPTSIICITRPR